jgi:hypothetical protein
MYTDKPISDSLFLSIQASTPFSLTDVLTAQYHRNPDNANLPATLSAVEG